MTQQLWKSAVCMAMISGVNSTVSAQSRLEGTVFDSLRTSGPLRGATVMLVEANRYASTDLRGRFHFDSVPDGAWSLAILHPILDSLDLQLPQRRVEVRGRKLTVSIFTPSVSTVYRAICSADRDADAGVLFGTVRAVEGGAPVPSATVHTSWTEFVLGGAGNSSRAVADSARSNTSGMYVLCDVPLQTELDVSATVGGQRTGLARVLVGDEGIARRDLTVSLTDSAAGAAGAPGRSRITGQILNDMRQPLAAALVITLDGADTVRTDEQGRFALDRVAAGTRTLEVRAIGSAPRTVVVDVPVSAAVDTAIQVSRAVQKLARYTVKSTAPDRSLMARSGFADRQRLGLGAFATQKQLAVHNYPTVAVALQSMRGVSLEIDASGRPLPMLRGGDSGRCIPTFIVDNMVMEVDGASPSPSVQKPFTDIEALVLTQQLLGIEVYSGATVPPELDRNPLKGCGVVVIWTR
ncbi:carboxypeptidase regulatory-like domain-containing protein [Gemmatimonas sp.]|uniref:carboxypeptidase regulatory-like domain-containing protein n=2 Tax=Gemmatimonas sp. TaxID=1962908 RepID=UPI0025BE333F|nr:carboxypeptidase regulatory-like domain-containing protein [Gemmatimonas sp.]MCA2993533.1 carboxypeptidase regulatory-like domain-containing protein [Gemmatimonas sp.]